MRDYGRVHHTFWSSSTTGPMGDDAKMLALYLMTCSHNTIAGMFRLPDGYVLEDLQRWDAERVSKGFQELSRDGFARRCPATKWVWICKHLEWNPPENPNQWKAVQKVVDSVPNDCEWREKANPFETVCETLTETLSEPENNSPVPVPVPVKGVQGGKSRKVRQAQTALPENFVVSDRVKAWALQQGLAGVIEQHFDAFVSTCKAKGYTYVDWDLALQNAIADDWAKLRTGQPRASPGGPQQLGKAGQATAANAQRLLEKWRQENGQAE